MGTVERIPHCSHWGAYTILVENGAIVGVEPFEHDPAPSPIIHSVAEWAKSDRRVLRPMVREGWLEKREKSDRRGKKAAHAAVCKLLRQHPSIGDEAFAVTTADIYELRKI